MTDFASPNMFNTKLLKCPNCQESSWCKSAKVGDAEREKVPIEEFRSSVLKIDKSLYLQIGMVIAAYLFLWIYSLYSYSRLSGTIPTHFSILLEPRRWGARETILITPLIATIFPVFHSSLLVFASKRSYKSLVYPFLTGLFIFILLLQIMILRLHQGNFADFG